MKNALSYARRAGHLELLLNIMNYEDLTKFATDIVLYNLIKVVRDELYHLSIARHVTKSENRRFTANPPKVAKR